MTTATKDAHAVGSSDWVRLQAEIALNGPNSKYPYAYIREVFADKVIVDTGYDQLIEIPFTVSGSELTLSVEAALPVQLAYVPKSESPVLTGPIVMKSIDAKQIAYAAVLVPGEPDSDGDVVTAEKIEEVAHAWLKDYRNIDLMHTLSSASATVVESYVTPAVMDVGEYSLPAGTWVMAAKVHDDDIWAAIKDGHLTGYSIMGVRKAALKSAIKSDGAALKRTLLSDLGEDWICPYVSIVDTPAVPKAKFFALKSAPKPQPLMARLASALGMEPPAVSVKEDRKLSDKTYSALVAAHEAMAGLISEAEKERGGKTKPKDDEDDDKAEKSEGEPDVTLTIDEIKDAFAESMKPLEARLEALEAAKPEEPAEEAAKAEAPAEDAETVTALTERVAELESTLEEVAKRFVPAAKSRALKGQDGEEPEVAEKSVSEERDVFGRAKKKPYSTRR